MARQSEKLHQDFENICNVIENLGKQCIISGPIPSPSKGSECFSRLFSLHAWLKNFCLAAGYNYIGNFDYFWTRHDLYKSDGLHLNMEGVVQLISNLIHFIAFGL